MFNSFLRALEVRLGKKKDSFISLTSTVDTKFPAYRTFKLQVFLLEGNNKELISTVETNFNTTEENQPEKARGEVVQKTIENILKRYGL